MDAQQKRALATMLDMNVRDIEDLSGVLQALNLDEEERKNVHHFPDIFISESEEEDEDPPEEENVETSWTQKQVPKNPEQLKLKGEFQEGGIWDLKQETEEKTITAAGLAEGSRKQRRILGCMMGFLMITIAVGGLTLTAKEAGKIRLPYRM